MVARIVVLAPVPAIHIKSAMTKPKLLERVAFGTSAFSIDDIPLGTEIFIYASNPPHLLCRPGMVTFGGSLGCIELAETGGRRDGKHRNKDVRPPSAEATDGPFTKFGRC